MGRRPRHRQPDRPLPLAHWDSEDPPAPGLVWWAQLDGRYLVEVVRNAGSAGCDLRILDHSRGDLLLADQPVALSGDSSCGPAIDDVVAWQRLAIEIVDGRRSADHCSKGEPL